MNHPCSLCDGTGTTEGVKCPRCDGTGQYFSFVLSQSPPSPAEPEGLLPCPFCGTIPKLPNDSGTQYGIVCEDCGQGIACIQISDLMTIEERLATPDLGPENNWTLPAQYVERAKIAAIAAWNRRPSQPSPEPEVKPRHCDCHGPTNLLGNCESCGGKKRFAITASPQTGSGSGSGTTGLCAIYGPHLRDDDMRIQFSADLAEIEERARTLQRELEEANKSARDEIPTFRVSDPSNGQWEREVVDADYARTLRTALSSARAELEAIKRTWPVEYEKQHEALTDERDKLAAELEAERERCRQMVAGKVHDDQMHMATIARISHEQAATSAALELAQGEREEAMRQRESTRQWYAERWEPLKQWARADLPDELRDQFFNIIANATKTVMDRPPTLTIQLNLMRHERDAAKAALTHPHPPAAPLPPAGQ